jgi:predicted dehydrogenase
MQRRYFLGASTALSAGAVMGSNSQIRVGIIGAGGRGRYLIGEFKEVGAQMTAVCDIYKPNLRAGLDVANTGARSFSDYRRLLDDRAIDAVIVATPDHWHAPMVIDAVQAGKDVYVEKPLAHTIAEGFDIVRAVRQTKRIVQVGTQRRSSELFQAGKAVMSSTQLGDIHLVTSYWLNHQSSLSERKLEGELDWQQWLGSAPKRDLDPKRFFNWYYYWDYSGGLLIGQAAHIVDAIHWYMDSKYPLAVTCSGGKGNLPGAEVPETASVIMEYPENYMATFTLGYKAMRYNSFTDQLKQFHGTKARFDVGREHHILYPQTLERRLKASIIDERPGSFASATRAHIHNFLDCVRSRYEPNAPVESGQSTNIVLAMAMDSLRSGKRLRWNADKQEVEA